MLFSLLITTSCENADLQKSLPKDDEKITSRTIECEDCPEEDCCCGIQLISVTPTSLRMCGTNSPDNSNDDCGPIYLDFCTIEGKVLYLDLDYLEVEFFCMTPGTAFALQSLGAATYRISCQAGVLGTQSIDVPFTSAGNAYVTVNGDCEVSEHCE